MILLTSTLSLYALSIPHCLSLSIDKSYYNPSDMQKYVSPTMNLDPWIYYENVSNEEMLNKIFIDEVKREYHSK